MDVVTCNLSHVKDTFESYHKLACCGFDRTDSAVTLTLHRQTSPSSLIIIIQRMMWACSSYYFIRVIAFEQMIKNTHFQSKILIMPALIQSHVLAMSLICKHTHMNTHTKSTERQTGCCCSDRTPPPTTPPLLLLLLQPPSPSRQ